MSFPLTIAIGVITAIVVAIILSSVFDSTAVAVVFGISIVSAFVLALSDSFKKKGHKERGENINK